MTLSLARETFRLRWRARGGPAPVLVAIGLPEPRRLVERDGAGVDGLHLQPRPVGPGAGGEGHQGSQDAPGEPLAAEARVGAHGEDAGPVAVGGAGPDRRRRTLGVEPGEGPGPGNALQGLQALAR